MRAVKPRVSPEVIAQRCVEYGYCVGYWARKYKHYKPWLDYDELESAGNEGLVRAARQYRPDGDRKHKVVFITYCTMSIRNHMINYMKKKAKSYNETTEVDLEEALIPQSTNGGFRLWMSDSALKAKESSNEEIQALELVDYLFDRLEFKERELITQIYLEGRTQASVGDELGVKPAAMSWRVVTLLKKCRRILEGESAPAG